LKFLFDSFILVNEEGNEWNVPVQNKIRVEISVDVRIELRINLFNSLFMASVTIKSSKLPPMTMGGRIKEARVKKGLTIHELANVAGLSSPQISNYENDNLQPNTKILIRLSEKLGLSIDYMLNGALPGTVDILSDLPEDYRSKALEYIQLLKNDLKLKDISNRVKGI